MDHDAAGNRMDGFESIIDEVKTPCTLNKFIMPMYWCCVPTKTLKVDHERTLTE